MAKKPPKRRAATTPKTPTDPLRANAPRAHLVDRLQAAAYHLTGQDSGIAKAAAAHQTAAAGMTPLPALIGQRKQAKGRGGTRLKDTELKRREALWNEWIRFRNGGFRKYSQEYDLGLKRATRRDFARYCVLTKKGRGLVERDVLKSLAAHERWVRRSKKSD